MTTRSARLLRTRPALAALGLGLAGTLALAGCGAAGSDGAGSDDVEIGADAPTTDVETPATDTEPTESTQPAPDTPAPAATTGMAEPREAALRLYDAWFADDRATAATIAEPEAVEEMWKTARGDYSIYSGCDSAEFTVSGCLFRGANGTIQMTMERRGDLWIVIEAFYAEP